MRKTWNALNASVEKACDEAKKEGKGTAKGLSAGDLSGLLAVLTRGSELLTGGEAETAEKGPGEGVEEASDEVISFINAVAEGAWNGEGTSNEQEGAEAVTEQCRALLAKRPWRLSLWRERMEKAMTTEGWGSMNGEKQWKAIIGEVSDGASNKPVQGESGGGAGHDEGRESVEDEASRLAGAMLEHLMKEKSGGDMEATTRSLTPVDLPSLATTAEFIPFVSWFSQSGVGSGEGEYTLEEDALKEQCKEFLLSTTQNSNVMDTAPDLRSPVKGEVNGMSEEEFGSLSLPEQVEALATERDRLKSELGRFLDSTQSGVMGKTLTGSEARDLAAFSLLKSAISSSLQAEISAAMAEWRHKVENSNGIEKMVEELREDLEKANETLSKSLAPQEKEKLEEDLLDAQEEAAKDKVALRQAESYGHSLNTKMKKLSEELRQAKEVEGMRWAKEVEHLTGELKWTKRMAKRDFEELEDKVEAQREYTIKVEKCCELTNKHMEILKKEGEELRKQIDKSLSDIEGAFKGVSEESHKHNDVNLILQSLKEQSDVQMAELSKISEVRYKSSPSNSPLKTPTKRKSRLDDIDEYDKAKEKYNRREREYSRAQSGTPSRGFYDDRSRSDDQPRRSQSRLLPEITSPAGKRASSNVWGESSNGSGTNRSRRDHARQSSPSKERRSRNEQQLVGDELVKRKGPGGGSARLSKIPNEFGRV